MTNNLDLVQVAAAQNQKEVTINQQAGELDAAITENLAIDLVTDGSTVLTDSQFRRNIGFTLTHDDQLDTLTVPGSIPRFFFVDNSAGTDACDVIKGATTITIATGEVASFITDNTANGMSLVASSNAVPFDIGSYQTGLPATSDIVLRFVFTRDVTFPSGLTGSEGYCNTTPTTTALTLDIFNNASDVGDVSFAAASNTATFTMASPQTFNAGDRLEIDVNTVDSGGTAADFMVTLRGTRGT